MSSSQLGQAQRLEALARLRDETFDVVVVGGGVTGAGAALDAATRGLSVALLERRDLAAGTSSRSSKLIHGGLRYLEQRNFGLVREALKERSLLLQRLCPHLVHPVPFLLPLQAQWQRPYYGAGVLLYDTLGGARAVPHHRHLSRRAALREAPGLRADALVGAIQYYDAQVDDARHTLAVARTAAGLGAAVATGVEMVDLRRDGARVVGVEARETTTGERFEVRGRTVVVATGVWTDEAQQLVGGSAELKVRASKGVHFLIPRARFRSDTGLILRTEKSVLFVIPWGSHWLIGTTDTDWTLDKTHPAATRRDIDYLLERVNAVFVDPIGREDIEGVYAGLRPLVSAADTASTAQLSREHSVVTPAPGLVVVAGGKYTTYRVMGEDAVDAAARFLPGSVPASATEDTPLVGADGYHARLNARARIAATHGLTVAQVDHLLGRYGGEVEEVLRTADDEPELLRPIEGAEEYLAVEARYAATHEAATHLEHVLARRTHIAIETRDRGVEAAEAVARLMAPALGWDEVTVRGEVDAYRAQVEAERLSQEQATDEAANAVRLDVPDVGETDAAGALSTR
ncbi:MAG: Glycerol-3-phosphate dehydrogenase [uncultured Thermoleophilia bacterium]|uniref:Glycerol-3-phosphate dehydrogenase n=1 Tax=uncultured Thermoleophilia bacterium TaxID=1497501 RepID=A0A6J4U3U1_9ACTN|nr:MAG: Glycerol-3-phosphate dehydrogenase [uncultured Thermoleophilia bacterium]